jgi:hypothetical protein
MAYDTITVQARTYPWTSIMAAPYSCDPTGVSDCAAALETLKSDHGDIGTIHIPKGTFRIATDLTIPSGMTLVLEAGAVVNIEKDGIVDADVIILGILDCSHGGVITVAADCSLTISNYVHGLPSITGAGTITYTIGSPHLVVATASLPAGATAMNGQILIENAGAGDRNLIVYAGGQRFRIDGGTAF